MQHAVRGMKGAALNLEGGGNEHAHRRLCTLPHIVESKRGDGLVVDCTGVTLLGVQFITKKEGSNID